MSSKRPQVSNKRILIDKSNASMVIVVAAAAFITVFSVVSSRALLSQRAYKSRVIIAQKKALTQLKANNKAATQLVASYTAFVSPTENIIGGNISGTGDKDGDNGKIVLDALPSKYDFPAIATSLEKIIVSQNYKVSGISGSDDEINQAASSSGAASATPIEIPFQINVTGSVDGVQGLIDIFQRSIRPIKVARISVDGKDASLNISVEAKTYYQPEKVIKITSKVVK